jgi:predicted secreted protein
MKFSSIIAIYALFWSFSVFFVLPFRLRSSAEPDVIVPGQMNGAPPRFSLKRTLIWTTWVSLALFGLYYLNYVNGWVQPEILDFFTASRPA